MCLLGKKYTTQDTINIYVGRRVFFYQDRMQMCWFSQFYRLVINEFGIQITSISSPTEHTENIFGLNDFNASYEKKGFPVLSIAQFYSLVNV